MAETVVWLDVQVGRRKRIYVIMTDQEVELYSAGTISQALMWLLAEDRFPCILRTASNQFVVTLSEDPVKTETTP